MRHRRLLPLVSLWAGCGAASTGPRSAASRLPAPASIGEHLAALRKEADRGDPGHAIGRLARGLPAATPDQVLEVHAMAGLTPGPSLARTMFAFESRDAGRICFRDTEFVSSFDERPVDAVRADLFARYLAPDAAIWVVAADHLAELAAAPPWPPPPGATRLDALEITSDEVETYTHRKDLGDGHYFEEKEDKRTLELRLCGPAPEIPDSTGYLVVGSHVGAVDKEREYDPEIAETAAAGGDSFYADQFRFLHDAIVVFAISDDGSPDLDR